MMKNKSSYSAQEKEYLLEHILNTHKRIQARDAHAAFHKIENKLGFKQKYGLKKIWIGIAAACVGVFLLSTLWISQMRTHQNALPQYITLEANAGMRGSFYLPDSSQVFLNSGSKITYPVYFNDRVRRVKLSGEAYFKVKKNEKAPFIVGTVNDEMSIRVYGTEFNVQALPHESTIYTTLVEGSVALQYNNRIGDNKEFLLKPAQQAAFKIDDNSITLRNINPDVESSWIKGELLFADTPMHDVLRRLSMHYQVQFEVKDAVIYQHRFTGIFKDRPLDQVLDYISLSSNIHYHQVPNAQDDTHEKTYSRITLNIY